MAKAKLSAFDIEILSLSPEGKKYLEYNETIGGERFGYCIGCPDIDTLYGGEIGLYEECIRRGVTWEELLDKRKQNWDELKS